MRVFLLEDHDDTRVMLKLFLELRGHYVLEANSVAQALLELPLSETQLLISDVGLPDGFSWDLLWKMNGPGSRYAVTMSGLGSEEDRRRSLAGGYHEHLVKPIDHVTLDAVLARAAAHVGSM